MITARYPIYAAKTVPCKPGPWILRLFAAVVATIPTRKLGPVYSRVWFTTQQFPSNISLQYYPVDKKTLHRACLPASHRGPLGTTQWRTMRWEKYVYAGKSLDLKASG